MLLHVVKAACPEDAPVNGRPYHLAGNPVDYLAIFLCDVYDGLVLQHAMVARLPTRRGVEARAI